MTKAIYIESVHITKNGASVRFSDNPDKHFTTLVGSLRMRSNRTKSRRFPGCFTLESVINCIELSKVRSDSVYVHNHNPILTTSYYIKLKNKRGLNCNTIIQKSQGYNRIPDSFELLKVHKLKSSTFS